MSGILYPLFLLFIMLVTLIVFNLTQSRFLISKQKQDLMNKINGDSSAFEIILPTEDIYTLNSEIDLMKDVKAVGRGSTGAKLTYTSNPSFDSTKEGTYTITYTAVSTIGITATKIREITIIKEKYNYVYTGNYQEFIVPINGYYQLEAWGAQGVGRSSAQGGAGGYASGAVYLEKDTKIYIVVGGQNAYNGGGPGNTYMNNGGGATHIAKQTGLLSELSSYKDQVLIVGGGGGAGGYYSGSEYGHGGFGGGFNGGDGRRMASAYGVGGGGGQTAAGAGGSFGKGSTGAGGGYYGGGSNYVTMPGGGGSSYIGALTTYKEIKPATLTGGEVMPNPSGGTMTGNSGNGYASVKYLGNLSADNNGVYDYAFNSSYQKFVAPEDGVYSLEVWGAQGVGRSSAQGGQGGYSTGKVQLKKGETLYIYVGGQTSYNGGGAGNTYMSNGGGATHIAKQTGLLSELSSAKDSIVIVAGGGGAGGYYSGSEYGHGGFGGGLTGGDGRRIASAYAVGIGGSQTAAGSGGTFGKGGTGAGGGYYGGGTNYITMPGGGGSSYINGLIQGQTISGGAVMPNYNGGTMTGNTGHGYAKIEYKGKDIVEPGTRFDYIYTGNLQEFVVPKEGYYQLESWGAQGGNSTTGGRGAYTSGKVYLNVNEKIYIAVGGAGIFSYPSTNAVRYNGGYNGGGVAISQSCCSRIWGSGGGATDFRLVDNKLESRIMVAAGGGGCYYPSSSSSACNNGAAGGALNGFNGVNADYTGYAPGQAATQISGGPVFKDTTSTSQAGFFGIGGGYPSSNTTMAGAAGGGGGYYGGGGSGHVAGAASGSSYISGYPGCIAIKSETDQTPKVTTYSRIEDSYHYSGKIFVNTEMKAGNEVMPNYNGGTQTGNPGNGYARITYIGKQ